MEWNLSNNTTHFFTHSFCTHTDGNGYSNGKSNGQNYTNGHHKHNGVNGSHKNGFHHQPIGLSFKVFLVNAQTNAHSEEWRQLRFFFHTDDESGSVSREYDDFSTAQSFFRDLVNPTDFPANYVGYIMKIMKLMQQKYPTILKMEVEMKVIRELAELPDRPGEYLFFPFSLGTAVLFLLPYRDHFPPRRHHRVS